MALTGPLAANGKMSLVAMKIWEEDVNAKGGLLGRPVKLIYYDDQSSPATVPGIYTKLLDVDKVDFAVSPYASTQVAPAMPIMMQKKRLYMSLFGTGINDEFKYDKYFSMIADGTEPEARFHHRLLQDRSGAEARSRRASRWLPPTPSSAAMPARARARTRRMPACASSTTRTIRRTQPISLPSCAPSRRAILICSSSARIRSTRLGW